MNLDFGTKNSELSYITAKLVNIDLLKQHMYRRWPRGTQPGNGI